MKISTKIPQDTVCAKHDFCHGRRAGGEPRREPCCMIVCDRHSRYLSCCLYPDTKHRVWCPVKEIPQCTPYALGRQRETTANRGQHTHSLFQHGLLYNARAKNSRSLLPNITTHPLERGLAAYEPLRRRATSSGPACPGPPGQRPRCTGPCASEQTGSIRDP